MANFDASGHSVEDISKFIFASNEAVRREVLTAEQADLIVAIGKKMHAENDYIIVNDALKIAIDENPGEFSNFDYNSAEELEEENSGRVVLLFFGVGLVAGFYYAMTE